MNLKNFKNIIQSSHLNFLFGSGLSKPYLATLGKIENWLTEAEKINDKNEQKLVKASLYAKYFKDVMLPCINTDSERVCDFNDVNNNYDSFLNIWNDIVAKRNIGLLDKQINIFSTNIDNFVENAAERIGVEFNDGFQGHLKPIFREDSFNNIVSKVSILYSNRALIPNFNLFKLHGSITWCAGNDENIYLDSQYQILNNVINKYNAIYSNTLFTDFKEETTFDTIKNHASTSLLFEDSLGQDIEEFVDAYSKLVMINPQKTKFRETVLDLHFYELMRLFSNALEKSSSLLIVAGFSFADEHISKIIVRAANTNPTLLVLIFAFNEDASVEIQDNISKGGSLLNNNIKILTPNIYKQWCDNEFVKNLSDLSTFDFESLNNYVFKYLL